MSDLFRVSRMIYAIECILEYRVSDAKYRFSSGQINDAIVNNEIRAAQLEADTMVLTEIKHLTWDERVELFSKHPDARSLLSKVLTREQIIAGRICGD